MSNSRMPVVYVAGPYRGLNRDAVELNIQVARAVGLPIYANDNDLPTAERFLEKYRIAG